MLLVVADCLHDCPEDVYAVHAKSFCKLAWLLDLGAALCQKEPIVFAYGIGLGEAFIAFLPPMLLGVLLLLLVLCNASVALGDFQAFASKAGIGSPRRAIPD